MILTVTSKCKKIPDWIPENDVARFSQETSDPAEIVAAYVKQKCLEIDEYLGLQAFSQNEALDVLDSGDAYINLASNALPEEEQAIWQAPDREATIQQVKLLQRKMKQDGRDHYQIYALQGLNPSAVWLYPDYAGRIVDGRVVHLLGEGVWPLNLNNLIHLKAFTWNWVVYGIPHYISALRWVDIKMKMMDALYTSASRYVTPREWLEIAGPKSPDEAALPPTDDQMAWGDQIINNYSLNLPFILPTGWAFKLLGAEGKVLKLDTLLEKVDDAIRTAAQVSRTFTSGAANVPAYATSKLQAGVMYKAIGPLASMFARAIEGRILQRFCLMNGFFEEDGTLIAPKIEFRPLPIQGDDSVENKINVMGQLGWLSPITAWEWEGLDPGLEMERIDMARRGMVEPFRALAPDLSPDQMPDRYMDVIEELQQKMELLNNARGMGHRRVMEVVGRYIYAFKHGNMKVAERYARELGKYLTEAQFLKMSDARTIRAKSSEEVLPIMDEQEALIHDKRFRKESLDKAAVVSTEVRNHQCKTGNGVVQ